MRTFRLAQVAAEAEGLRIRRRVRRFLVRGVITAIAVVWLLAGLTCGHLAVWMWLSPRYGALPTILGLLIFDLVVGGAMLALGLSSSPDAAERQALQIRDEAWSEIKSVLTMTSVVQPLMRMVLGQLGRIWRDRRRRR